MYEGLIDAQIKTEDTYKYICIYIYIYINHISSNKKIVHVVKKIASIMTILGLLIQTYLTQGETKFGSKAKNQRETTQISEVKMTNSSIIIKIVHASSIFQ